MEASRNPSDVIGPVLEHDDLRRLARLGPRCRLASLEGWCRARGIRYQYDARGGIWTTVDALNEALGVASAANDDAGDYPVELFGGG